MADSGGSRRFLDALRSGRVLLMDGAMGTELIRAGLKPGECGEAWNLTHPERVRAVQRAYVEAGADVLLTNTFLANPVALRRQGLEERCEAICRAAVEHARTEAGSGRCVIASIGPCQREEELKALPRLVEALAAAQPDGFLVETCSELSTLVQVRNAVVGLGRGAWPLLISFTYRRDRQGRVRTVDGFSPRKMARWASDFPIATLGVNCGRDLGLPQILEAVEAYREETWRPVFARPNAGAPQQVEGNFSYPFKADYMASWLPELLEVGVRMIGGCCGTTPAHIAAFRPLIDAWNAQAGACT
jgi:5-methyltetrahydrofolate--homocysteine methyltransferase